MKRDTRVKLNALVVLDQPPKKGRRWLRARHSETPPRRACRNKRRCPRGWPHGFHHVFRRSIAREVPANARADALQVMRNPLHCRIFSAAWTLVAFLWKCCAVSRACNCATALVPRLVSFVLPKLLKEKQLSVSKNCRRHLDFSFWLLFRYSNVGRSALFSSGLTYFVLTFSPVPQWSASFSSTPVLLFCGDVPLPYRYVFAIGFPVACGLDFTWIGRQYSSGKSASRWRPTTKQYVT